MSSSTFFTSWLRLAEMSKLLKKACSSPPSLQNYEAHRFTFEAYFEPPPHTLTHMVSITLHTENTSPKQPFCHMYLVVPCAQGI